MMLPEEDIPPEVKALRESLNIRDNAILNTIGIMAMLDGHGHRDAAEALHETLKVVGNVTPAEFNHLCELHNQSVEIVQLALGEMVFEFDSDELNG